jgi:hypothetical protein
MMRSNWPCASCCEPSSAARRDAPICRHWSSPQTPHRSNVSARDARPHRLSRFGLRTIESVLSAGFGAAWLCAGDGSPAARKRRSRGGLRRQRQAGFGSAAKAACSDRSTLRSPRRIVQRSMPFTVPLSRPAARITARQDCGRIIIRTITRPSCSIRTVTISRLCVTRRCD